MHRQQQSQDDLLTLILNTLVQFWPIPVMMIAVNLLGMAWYWGLLAGLTVYAIFFWKDGREQHQQQEQAYQQYQPQYLPQQPRLLRPDAEAKTVSHSFRTAEEILTDFRENFIGLEPVKRKMYEIVKVIEANQHRCAEGLPVSTPNYHMIFTGNPGTGKTAVARVVADLFAALRVFGSEPRFVEVDRSGLVAEYIGQTAVKVNNVVDSALGGVLFVDEAYALTPKHERDFGHEAIATLIKRLEDDRDRFCCIFAGYTREMDDFLKSNPGIKSRITFVIEFPDYNLMDLLKIAELELRKSGYEYGNDVLLAIKRQIILTATGEEPLPEEMADIYTCREGITLPGNARDVRKIVEAGIRSANVAGRYRHVEAIDFSSVA
jgi:hypothetical protein